MEDKVLVGVSALMEAVDKATGEKPYLGDPVFIDQFLRSFIKDAIDRKDPKDDGEACLAAARLFLGRDKNYSAMPDWNAPGGIDVFLSRVLNITETDSVKLVATAFAQLLLDIYSIIDFASQPGVLEEQWNWQINANIETYQNLLLGIVVPLDEENPTNGIVAPNIDGLQG